MKNEFKVGDYVNLNPLAIHVNPFFSGSQVSFGRPKVGDEDVSDRYSEILKELPLGIIVKEESHRVLLDGIAYKVYQTRWAENMKELNNSVGYVRVDYIYEKALLPNTLAEKPEEKIVNTITSLNLDL